MNFSLRAKILFSVSIVGVGLLSTAGIAYRSLNSVTAEQEKINGVTVRALGHISGMRTRSRQIHADLLRVNLLSDAPEKQLKAKESFAKALSRYSEIENEYAADMQPYFKETPQDFVKIQASFSEVQRQGKVLTKLAGEASEAVAQQDFASATEMIRGPIDDAIAAHQKSLLALDDEHVSQGETWTLASQKMAHAAIQNILWSAGLMFCLGLGLSVWITSRLNSAINVITKALSNNSAEVTESARLLAEISEELSSSTTEQASAVHETVSSNDEISAMVEKNTTNADHTLTRAKSSHEDSERGHHAVQSMMTSLGSLNQLMQDMESRLKTNVGEVQTMATVIEKIGDETKVINDIVFQTKLLSFNASVEAARAGEHGKGFAVVAEEVGNLARMSGSAAQSIAALLEQSLRQVRETVQKSESGMSDLLASSEKVLEQSQQSSSECDEILRRIETGSQEVFNLVVDIQTASKEQSQGIAEIGKAMREVDATTQRNSKAVDRCASTAEQLHRAAHEAEGAVSSLLSFVYGHTTEATSLGASAEEKHKVSPVSHMKAA